MTRSKLLNYTNKKKACLAVMILGLTSMEEKNQKKTWARKWLLRRKKLGCYDNLLRELALEDAEGYRRYLRMDTAAFEYLLELVSPLIAKKDTIMRKAIPPGERLALTLRYLATGETQSSMAYQFRIAQNTISGIIPSVCEAIYYVLKDTYFHTPSSELEWKEIARNFYDLWQFPMCLGAMDGKHIKIVPPPNSGSDFYNYKKDFSVVLLALVDANLKFIYVDIGTNGRISDGGVYAKCDFKKALEGGKLGIPQCGLLPSTSIAVPYVIVADDAFPLTTYIMKPYPGHDLEDQKRIFNYRLSRARRVSENAFGILAMRFQVFKGSIPTTVCNVKKIVLASCVLHNFLREKACAQYVSAKSLDREDISSGTVEPGEWRKEKTGLVDFKKVPLKAAKSARDVRDCFSRYFIGKGAVPWQEKMCLLH